MKILRIRLNNLNSLKGEHLLDLTAEPLGGAGLFAITGPTGAGKTTILDAVTLALYGKAARYGNESNPEHMMSRHCGDCSAEVEFEVPSGVYRAVWERRRAGKKPEGKLQPPKRYIYDAAGEPLAQQIREAEEKIESLLGLNYDRFLRSVLLAQGEFARFLKANANERAELLESLTGTVIYSRLGRLAHEQANQREAALKAKEAGLEQIAILEGEARKELEAAIKEGEENRQKLTGEIESGAAMLAKIASLEEARQKEKAATAEQGKIQKDQQDAAADLERLRLHRLTQPFAEDLARLDVAQTTMGSAVKLRQEAEKNHAAAKDDLLESNHLFRSSIAAALAARQQEAKEAGETVTRETKAAVEARAWLTEHKRDAVLADQLGDLVVAISELNAARNSLASAWTGWKQRAAQILPDAAGPLPETLESTTESELQISLDSILGKAEKWKELLEVEGKKARKLLELREDHLKKTRLVARLEDHRHDLKSGEPCPLCGALEHPFAEGAAPNVEIAELEAEVKKASDQLDEDRGAFHSFSSTLRSLTDDRGSLLDGVRSGSDRLKKLKELLQPIGVKVPEPGAEEALRAELQQRERDYRSHTKAEEDAIKRKTEAEGIARTAAEESANLKKKIAALEPLPAGVEFKPVAADDLPSVPAAEEAFAAAVQEEKTTATQARDRLRDEKSAAEKLAELKGPLELAVAVSEFKTLDALREARLAAAVALEIENIDNGLKKRTAAAEALLNEARKDIATRLEGKVLEGEEAAAFKASQARLKEDFNQLLEEQTTRRNRIKTDGDNRKLRQEKEKELEEDRKALTVWRRLRELIGSHDGAKFRRYAQAISLDILTRHANRHLSRLSDRYRICRDDEEELNLQIEDLHQAGVRRPMASLSGGESFLASLALALGLSNLAGRTVRIDSLFIDEGFGNLDPETLEVAIAALESLRQDHKTVGVISHVELLKERIGTQIVVEKKSGGISRIRVLPEVPATGW